MCAIFAWKYVELDAATAPDVDGPSSTSTLLSATYFWASACAGAGPCSTGVSPSTNLTFSPSGFARVLTAYFAHAPCSAPRRPAPPVTGVTRGSVIVLLQLTLAAEAAATLGLPCADAATTEVMASTARARPIAFFIWFLLAETVSLRGVALIVESQHCRGQCQ